MSAVTVIHESPGEKRVLFAFTVDQYHRMIEDGTLPEGEALELIHGQVARKIRSAAGEDVMTVGEHHIWCVKRLAKLGPALERQGCHTQTQQPVTLPPYNEPEPDGAVVVGTEDHYLRRKPGAGDVTCVIEVADSSLDYDRTVKLGVYADSGIPLYYVVNINDRCIEVYKDPRAGTGHYGTAEQVRVGQSIMFPTPVGPGLEVPARELLPP